MESHFFSVLIFLRRGAESEVAQLHLRALNLQTIPIFYNPRVFTPPSSLLRGVSHLFLINRLHLHYLLARSALPSVSLLSFPSLRRAALSCDHPHASPLFALAAPQSACWAIFGPADD